MTEMRINLPENNGIPMIIEHDEFLEQQDITLNLEFGDYELNYDFMRCGGGGEGHGDKVGVPHLTIMKYEEIVFSEGFNNNWILFLDITKKSRLKHKIEIKIYNMDDSIGCETCDHNRFNFELNALVDSYIYYFYSPRKGPYKKHPLPTKAVELSEEIRKELK
jgi:hypothetical protein